MTQKRSSFWFKAQRIIMCFLVMFMVERAVMPQPAQAKVVVDILHTVTELVLSFIDIIKKVYKNLQAVEIINQITEWYNLVVNKFGKLFDRVTNNAQATSFTKKVMMAEKVAVGQALVDGDIKSTLIGAKVKHAMEHAPPKDDFLCKAIVVNQEVLSSERYMKEGSRMLAEAISYRDRTPYSQGDGGDYTSGWAARRKQMKYGSPLDGTNPTDISGTKSSDGRGFDDADIAPVDGGLVYEMPIFEEKTYRDVITGQTMKVLGPAVTDPTNLPVKQQFFLAAWDNIFHLVGPRPTAPGADGMETDNGKRQRAMFNHCVASENALVKPCTDLLMFYTRPPTDWTDYRARQQAACSNMEGIVDLARFDNCSEGLSPYEGMLLAQLMCKSPQHAVAMKLDGATDADVLRSSDLCQLSWNAFTAYVAKLHASCTRATVAMSSLHSCYAAVH